MIDTLLSKISKYLLQSAEGTQNYHKYESLKDHEGWQVHQGLLVEIMNQMSSHMLSSQFTKLDKEEKDVQQRAFYIVKEIVEFLLSPLKNAEQYAALKEATKKKQVKNSKKKITEPKT